MAFVIIVTENENVTHIVTENEILTHIVTEHEILTHVVTENDIFTHIVNHNELCTPTKNCYKDWTSYINRHRKMTVQRNIDFKCKTHYGSSYQRFQQYAKAFLE